MRKHSGMRPHDIVILLKITVLEKNKWNTLDLSRDLKISQSEISESLNRSMIAGLLSPGKKEVMRLSLLEFLIHGLKYVFPARPGKIVRGIATAHSAKPVSDFIVQSDDVFVWESDEGNIRGQEIEPLYSNCVFAAMNDNLLYELLALVDVIRTGNAREFNIAKSELERKFKNDFV
ncbi:MAG: hypothetical protein MUE56_07705 [Ignavibacteria bacterium]|nr:hypothetical protein [Ignavibacteria bacterium]